MKSKKSASTSVEQAPPVLEPAGPSSELRVTEAVWPIESIVPYERNARTHDQAQIDLLRASYREFGEVNPLLIDQDGVIIAGHGRYQALLQEKFEQVRVYVAHASWTDDQKKKYRLLDNQSALRSGWDKDLLKAEVVDLYGRGVSVEQIGFLKQDAPTLLFVKSPGLTAPDAAPPEPPIATSRRGDLWILGNHRLICGDSTNPADAQRVLAGDKPHLMVTDPPYGVKYDAAWRVKVGVGGDGTATGKVLNDDRADWREAWALFPGHVAYIWHAGSFCGVVSNSLEAERFKVRAHIVWVKQRHVFGRGDYHFQHEPAFYAVREDCDESWNFVPEHEVATYTVREGKPGHYDGGRKQSTVWNIEHIKSDTGHSTQKPVECMKRPIENNSKPGDTIYEPFSGSGTTIIACEMTGRHCRALELNPPYVDIDVVRWQEFTGREAILEGDGRTFAEVRRARLVEAEPIPAPAAVNDATAA